MRGSVYRRGKSSWVIVYDEPRDEDGKRKQRWRGGFRTRKEAQAALARVVDNIGAGDYTVPEKIGYGTFVRERYLPAVAATKRVSTHEGYERMLKGYVLPFIGGVQLQRLDASRLDRLYRDLVAGDPTTERKPLSANTVRTIHAIVSGSLTYAERKGLVARNHAKLADVPQATSVKRTIWSPRETRTFLDYVGDDPLYALWRLMCLGGLRRGEALGVRWIDLNLDTGTVRIEQQVVPTREGLRFHPPKSEAGRREVALDEVTLDALREHRERQLVERAIFDAEYEDHDLAFCRADGRPLNPGNLSARFATLRGQAGLPSCRLHDLRHAHASLSLHAVGLHPELMRRRLGHARISTTVDLYMQGRVDGADRAAAIAAAAAIDGAV